MQAQPVHTDEDKRRFLFLLASSRRNGNTEFLARQAATQLTAENMQETWLRLSELPLQPFEDIRHEQDGVYPAPKDHGLALLNSTLWATDIVFVAPLYWYGLPATAKLYLDHWSGWMRVPDLDFKRSMEGKTMWAVSVLSDEDMAAVEPLLSTLRMTADYMNMPWGGALLGYGNRPGEIKTDALALANARRFFATSPKCES